MHPDDAVARRHRRRRRRSHLQPARRGALPRAGRRLDSARHRAAAQGALAQAHHERLHGHGARARYADRPGWQRVLQRRARAGRGGRARYTSRSMSRASKASALGARARGVRRDRVRDAACAPSGPQDGNPAIPRTASGRPNLQGIWQVRNSAAADLLDHAARHEMRAGRSVVEGNEIPYQPWAAAKKLENAANRATADPLSKCYMPGVPRIMYMPLPVPPLPDRRPRGHHVRVVAGVPPDLHERLEAARRDRVLDGRLARPMGRRHAGRRRDQPQRQDLVRHGRQLPQRGAARWWSASR